MCIENKTFGFGLVMIWDHSLSFTKGGFFSESLIHFLDLQISKNIIPKNNPKLEI